MADKFPPAKGPKVPPMQPRITINNRRVGIIGAITQIDT